MIRVNLAEEPPHFDKDVRQPGLRAIRKLTGQVVDTEPGHPPKSAGKYSRPDDIPASEFNKKGMAYWRSVLDDLYDAYGGICAYLGIYIERTTGDPTVDHFIPKSGANWETVYEWQNYRLACTQMNRNKDEHRDVLDPFCVGNWWFQMEPCECQIVPAPTVDKVTKRSIENTIIRLKLNHPQNLKVRQMYTQAYTEGDITWNWLQKRAPFVAKELKRLGLLRPEDRG